MAQIPQLHMFAGPNGSGKSCLKAYLLRANLGVYVNPDEIEKSLKAQGGLHFADFKISADTQALNDFFKQSTLLGAERAQTIIANLQCNDNYLSCGGLAIDSYIASVLSDFLRHCLLAQGITFSFETVMSSPDKVKFLEKAQQAGFHTTLYFVATADVEINVARVANRVKLGGHPVPEDKIRERYQRSLGLLLPALRHCDEAYIFDNSGTDKILLVDFADGELIARTDQFPVWFVEAVWCKLNPFPDQAKSD
ncbi:zeta toxin family protein [Massilia sp. W12]|uniref:zeta toxin family protein n=1 Tax=Massilia sp. W12 TaxID=3126507 RepID=UPI0030D387DE